MTQTSLQGYLDTVYSYVYQIVDAEEFHLCLSKEWNAVHQGAHFGNAGYPSQMIHAIRYCSDRRNNTAGLGERFASEEMFPELYAERETPMAYFFTPVFFENVCFGYAVVSYGSQTRSYDDTYRRWIGTVCRSLEILRRTLIMQQMQEQLEFLHSSKFELASYAYDSLNADEKVQYQLVTKILDENLLMYHFQPIVSAVDRSVFAYEALMRSRTETKVPPLSIIRYATMQERLSDVERATFLNVLQFIDEHSESFGGARVFINSIPGVRTDEAFLSELEGWIVSHAEKVVKDGCTDIVIGRDEMVYKDISIIGTPQMKTDIHVRIEPGYKGSVTLEDVYFSNVNNRPAIELGENSCVTLVLVGFNTLFRAGIQVPESSKLVIEGEGRLLIDLDAAESYGVGNDHRSRHGEIVFEQDGLLRINCRSKDSICIGSGLGGMMTIPVIRCAE